MICDDSNTVLVRYNGPVGRHLVPSPLRKFTSYGMHTNGDLLCVHFDDQKTAPGVFVLIEEAVAADPEPDPQPTVAPEPEVQVAPEPVEPKSRAKKKDNGGVL